MIGSFEGPFAGGWASLTLHPLGAAVIGMQVVRKSVASFLTSVGIMQCPAHVAHWQCFATRGWQTFGLTSLRRLVRWLGESSL